MKDRKQSKILFFLCFIAAFALSGGILSATWVFRSLEQAAALIGMLSGSLIVLGTGLVVILLLHTFHRTTRIRKEEEALRKKNQAMEELNRQTQRLAHHQRLEIIGTLTSSIAHEFNNLLTPIMGNSILAMEQLPSDEGELYEELLEIYSASCKAKEIISRLSDLSRKNSENSFRQAAPDEVVRKMVRTAEPAKPKNVRINMNLNCWDQRLVANEIQLSQMILNLILNGFHAMEPEGGVLTLSTNFDESHIHIQISDTGCGIPKEIQPRIFEPFFTTKETGKGTGLGLAIVAQVVEDHRGKILVESKPGTGTTFTVSLPRAHILPEE